MRNRYNHHLLISGRQEGSILIGLIIIMVLFAFAGVAMLTITSTSVSNQAYSNNMRTAFSIAESGCRYASTRLTALALGDDCLSCHSSDSDQMISIIENDNWLVMNGVTHTLADNDGEFVLFFAPYWFRAEAGGLDIRSLTLTVSVLETTDQSVQANLPEVFSGGEPFFNGGHLCVGNQYVSYSSISSTDTGLTFHNIVTDGDPLIELVEDVLVYPSSFVSSAQTLTRGGDLVVTNNPVGTMYAFPNSKAAVSVNGKLVTYSHADESGGIWTLTGLSEADETNPVLPLNVNAGDRVTLIGCVEVTCTGAFADASETIVRYLWGRDFIQAPIVLNKGASPPSNYLSGGNFWWVKEGLGGQDEKGHNIFLSEPDEINTMAPGYVTGCATQDGCHQNLHAPNTSGTGDLVGRYGCTGCHMVDDTGHDWRYRHDSTQGGLVTSYPWMRMSKGHQSATAMGPEGIAHATWNAGATPSSHNEYLGNVVLEKTSSGSMTQQGNTMTGMCMGCHQEFNIQNTAADGTGDWIRHPVDWVVPDSGEFSNAFGAGGSGTGTYEPDTPVARPNLTGWTTSSSSVNLGSDMVMCLTCHMAHGGPFDYMLRWDYSQTIVGTTGPGQGKGCFRCHTDKDNPDYYDKHEYRCVDCHTIHNTEKKKKKKKKNTPVRKGFEPVSHLLNDKGEVKRKVKKCPHDYGKGGGKSE